MFKDLSHQLIRSAFGSRAAVGVSHIMGRLAGTPLPRGVMSAAISVYTKTMGVNPSEYVVPDGGFHSFNDFFGRRLREGVRPIGDGDNALASPCDGAVVGYGPIRREGETRFQIKGSTYTLAALLGLDGETAAYDDGGYIVIYLHPRDYHRVHVPVRGALQTVRHIPGTRFPVTEWCERRVSGIYEKNERMVFELRLPGGQQLTVVMVAAFGVGNIETPFDPGFATGQNVRRTRRFETPPELAPGDDLGAFLLGSTVVLAWSPGAVRLDDDLDVGPIQMGRRIGTVTADADSRT